jgi:CHAD domain-containing protein
MAYRLKRGKPVARELSRIVAKELGAARDELKRRSAVGVLPAVHAVRKHIKKTRAIVRLFEKDLGSDFRRFNALLRSVGRRLSVVRDADAIVETVQALRDHYPRVITPTLFRSLNRTLKAHKGRAASQQRANRMLAESLRTLRLNRKLPSRIRDVAGLRAMRGGAGRGYRRARRELAHVEAEPEDVQFHAWRRRTKDHWYHMRLLEGLNGRAHVRVRQLEQLQTRLGDDHNLVVLREAILAKPVQFGDERTVAIILGCIAKYQTTLRRRALKDGRRLFAPTPAAFRKQLDRWVP